MAQQQTTSDDSTSSAEMSATSTEAGSSHSGSVASGSGDSTSSGSGGSGSGAGSGGENTLSVSSSGGAGGSGGITGSGGVGMTGMTPVSSTGTPMPDRSNAQAVCARWNADRGDLSEGSWSGSLATCDPGDISAQGRQNALRMVNLYRWLADLPAVATDPMRNEQAQACALLMHANDDLSHDPPQTWDCWSELGKQGAETSNISGGPGVMSIDLYMLDPGNETTLGHRRIVLSNDLGPIGLGSTGDNGASCMQNIGGRGAAGKAWQAWPPPGAFPLQAYSLGWTSYSETGWSLQSEEQALEGATVTVSTGDTELPTLVSPLMGNYGNTSGLSIVPDGWEIEAGVTYSVLADNIASSISYDFSLVDCDEP